MLQLGIVEDRFASEAAQLEDGGRVSERDRAPSQEPSADIRLARTVTLGDPGEPLAQDMMGGDNLGGEEFVDGALGRKVERVERDWFLARVNESGHRTAFSIEYSGDAQDATGIVN